MSSPPRRSPGLRSWERFDREIPLRPWLYGIATNLARHHWRSTHKPGRTRASGIDPVMPDADLEAIGRVDARALDGSLPRRSQLVRRSGDDSVAPRLGRAQRRRDRSGALGADRTVKVLACTAAGSGWELDRACRARTGCDHPAADRVPAVSMDELEALRSFQADVPEPDPATAECAYRAAIGSVREPRRLHPVVAPSVCVAALLLVVLVAAAPWRGGPDVLERASAALASPAASHVLLRARRSPGHPLSGRDGFTIHLEAWLTSGSPYRFRVVVVSVRGEGVPRPAGRGWRDKYGIDQGAELRRRFGCTGARHDGFPVDPAELDPAGFIRQALACRARRVSRAPRPSRVARFSDPAQRAAMGGVGLEFPRSTRSTRTYRPVRVTNSALRPNASPLGFPMASLLRSWFLRLHAGNRCPLPLHLRLQGVPLPAGNPAEPRARRSPGPASGSTDRLNGAERQGAARRG